MSIHVNEDWRDASRVVRVDFLDVPWGLTPQEVAQFNGLHQSGPNGYSIELLNPLQDEVLKAMGWSKLLVDRGRDGKNAGDYMFLRIAGNFDRAVHEVIDKDADDIALVKTLIEERRPVVA